MAACTNSDVCDASCSGFDTIFNDCNRDHAYYSSYEACVCADGVRSLEYVLFACVACSSGNIGMNSYATYQKWATICLEFDENGEAAAISLDNESTESQSSYYHSSVIPAVTSYCVDATTLPPYQAQANTGSPMGSNTIGTGGTTQTTTGLVAQNTDGSAQTINMPGAAAATQAPIALLALAVGLRLIR